MIYFDKKYISFFKELAANNNRDWFLENKTRYEKDVKKPFEKFVSDLITNISKLDKNVQIKPSEAIFRINRDIRFSKDKTPYKLNASAIITPGGRKNIEYPGLYVEMGPEHLAMGGGAYQPSKEALDGIRRAIASNPAKFMKLIEEKKFASMWGEMQGERNKILPPEYKKVAEKYPLLFNKQFYYWVELKPSVITSDKLMSTVMDHYKVAGGVSKFLADAIH